MIESKEDALAFLRSLNAPKRLVKHVELVGEAADLLIDKLNTFNIDFDESFVQAGVVIHDVGKIQFVEELSNKGSDHEAFGKQLLEDKGVSPRLAKVCVTHANWRNEGISFEELIIALSDKLWKGKRVEDLERLVIEGISRLSGKDFWLIYQDVDDAFESIASQGHERLERSMC